MSGARGKRRPEVVDAPECTDCGVCCFSTLGEYVRVFGADWDRMGDVARGYTDFDGNRCYMRMEEGHCAALVIDPVKKRYTCAIYEERPDCCRVFERGMGGCRADRHEKGERPLLAVEALLRKRG